MSNLRGSSSSGSNAVDIRTLSIRPVAGELKRDDILSHFSAFGEVKHFRICNKTKRSFGYVSFTLAQSAAKALRVSSHIIGGRRVRIAAAVNRHQDVTTFLDLNDDCILEILSMKSLSVNDLCSVAETRPRLKEIASRAFRKEHKECDIRSLSEGRTRKAKQILKHFGPEIRHLQIRGGGSKYWSRKVLESVSEHCNNSLQSLRLENDRIPKNFTARLGSGLYHHLQKLSAGDCSSTVDLSTFEKTFLKMQQFKSWIIRFGDYSLLKSLISRHTNLKSLEIFCIINSSIAASIADCTQLETLACGIPAFSALNLSSLRHLKRVVLDCSSQNAADAVQGLENLQFLEHLTLHDAEIDLEFVGTLPQLKRLQTLELLACTELQNLNQVGDLDQLTTLNIHSDDFFLHLYDWDLVHLVKRLSKLKGLSVAVSESEVDAETYLKIVHVVRQRHDKSKLTFRLYCEEPDIYGRLLPDFARNAHLVEMILERSWDY